MWSSLRLKFKKRFFSTESPPRKSVSRVQKIIKRSVIAFTLGLGVYFIDLSINDDLNLLTDRFRTKLSSEERKDRPRVVILGSGWGSLSMLRKLQTDKFNVTVVSPRNYFLFTPLLASTTSGTLEVRSIMEPIRYFLSRSQATEANFIEAECTTIDHVNKSVKCVDNSTVRGKVSEFEVKYDHLVVAIGAETATFNTPGVKENAIYLRDISDTSKLRNRIMDCFETAVIPGQPVEEIKRLLSFVIVGGGPAGVESVAEINDWLNSDLRKNFPEVSEYVNIQLIEALPHILSMFEVDLVNYVEKKFKDSPNITLRTKSLVTEITPEVITIKNSETGEKTGIPYGALLWVTGNAQRPITKNVINAIGADNGQKNPRGITVDPQFRVKGADGMWAIGDCSFTGLPATAQVASQSGKYLGRLFNDNAEIMYEEVKKRAAQQQQQQQQQQQVQNNNNNNQQLSQGQQQQQQQEQQSSPAPTSKSPTESPSKSLLETALSKYSPFAYNHLGTFTYVGDYQAIMELKKENKIKSSGFLTWFWWRSVYMSKLLSVRNRVFVGIDWTKTFFFGRDISRG